ncbi:peptidylprolyl isomerase (plasmid) [Qingshengfaniella alkalisoli]|uniref:Parvulin-like PPIase n=2 Tax=Qingshengfaniella alkalisoli TaxID=2599296 RepID=A0A5B8IBS0_9RHOB|nr:peptidylprolyl isomerase [Qingshengfaniella alkalisoli]
MQIRSTLLLAPVFSFGLAGQVAAQDTVTADTVLATVNGDEITAGQLLLIRAQLPQQYQQVPPDALFSGLLDQVIQQTLLAQQVDSPDPQTKAALKNEERAVLASAALEDVVSAAVTDEAIQQKYDEAYADAEPTKEYSASHILVETEEEAADLKTQLDEGADFAELARENSTGPSGPNGGELGWFSEGMMVPEFEQAVMAMAPGQVSDPIETQFGWHVIKLTETRMADAPTLEEVRGELAGQIQQEAVEAHLNELTDGSEIDRATAEEIDPSFLTAGDLFDE